MIDPIDRYHNIMYKVEKHYSRKNVFPNTLNSAKVYTNLATLCFIKGGQYDGLAGVINTTCHNEINMDTKKHTIFVSHL